jgi:hypothetical protein
LRAKAEKSAAAVATLIRVAGFGVLNLSVLPGALLTCSPVTRPYAKKLKQIQS